MERPRSLGRVRFVLVHHEEAAAFMATAHVRPAMSEPGHGVVLRDPDAEGYRVA